MKIDWLGIGKFGIAAVVGALSLYGGQKVLTPPPSADISSLVSAISAAKNNCVPCPACIPKLVCPDFDKTHLVCEIKVEGVKLK